MPQFIELTILRLCRGDEAGIIAHVSDHKGTVAVINADHIAHFYDDKAKIQKADGSIETINCGRIRYKDGDVLYVVERKDYIYKSLRSQ